MLTGEQFLALNEGLTYKFPKNMREEIVLKIKRLKKSDNFEFYSAVEQILAEYNIKDTVSYYTNKTEIIDIDMYDYWSHVSYT